MLDNFFLNGIIIAETVLLFLSTNSKRKIISLLTLSSVCILSLFLLINYFDKSLFTTTETESIKIEERRIYLNKELKRIYGNKIGIFYFDRLRPFFNKLSSNLFSILDLTQVFLQYPLVLTLLAILGIILFILDIKTIPLIYFLIVICTGSFIVPKQNILLMLPLINFFILQGFIESLRMAKKKFLKV